MVRSSASVLLCILYASSGGVAETPLEYYIYPGEEVVQLLLALGDEDLENSLLSAVDHLLEQGGEDILICCMQRIEAPLAGYLIDGLWNAEIDGTEFTTFRIGIRDTGVPFVLIGRGVDSNGRVHWYPPPGPDYRQSGNEPVPERQLDYEYLIGREAFEMLEEHYSRPEED